ncbi:MAG TPA: GNAT family N-acetyltransferase [Anaerolineae bacterium]
MAHPMPEMMDRFGENLVVRNVGSEQDAERFVALSAKINGEAEGILCARLIQHHPATTWDDYTLVEDERTGEVVSTTCLIPWRMQYENVTLYAAMLEMVVTHPEYRRRGLVRAQIERFHRTTRTRGFDLNIIQGIPYYYRQYGYTYALDHQPHDGLPAALIPPPSADITGAYQVRRATLDDIPALTALYHASLVQNRMYTLRTPAYWRYLLQPAQHDVRVINESQHDGQLLGYIAIHGARGPQGIEVSECGATSHSAAMALLSHLTTETHGLIRLGGAGHNAVLQAAQSLGSTPLAHDQWLIHITDIAGFLMKIGPALEQRVSQSDCAGLSAQVCINLFREAFLLHFERGKLAEVSGLGFVDASMGADGGDLCIPRDALVRLALGYRGLDELRDAWPDIVVRPGSRHLFDVLFPRMASCVWMPY